MGDEGTEQSDADGITHLASRIERARGELLTRRAASMTAAVAAHITRDMPNPDAMSPTTSTR